MDNQATIKQTKQQATGISKIIKQATSKHKGTSTRNKRKEHTINNQAEGSKHNEPSKGTNKQQASKRNKQNEQSNKEQTSNNQANINKQKEQSQLNQQSTIKPNEQAK
jgi:hypothetical protein